MAKRRKKRDKKMKYIADLADFISKQAVRSFQNIEELEKFIDYTMDDRFIINIDGQDYSKVDILKLMSIKKYAQKLLENVNRCLRLRQKEVLINSKIRELEKIADKYAVIFIIRDMHYFKNGTVSIKFIINDTLYLERFHERDLTKFIESLKEEIIEHSKDIVRCPFCKKKYKRSELINIEESNSNYCSCGAIIIRDDFKGSGLSIVARDILKEGLSQMNLRTDIMINPDYIFENIRYVSSKFSIFGFWFIKPEWQLRSLPDNKLEITKLLQLEAVKNFFKLVKREDLDFIEDILENAFSFVIGLLTSSIRYDQHGDFIDRRPTNFYRKVGELLDEFSNSRIWSLKYQDIERSKLFLELDEFVSEYLAKIFSEDELENLDEELVFASSEFIDSIIDFISELSIDKVVSIALNGLIIVRGNL